MRKKGKEVEPCHEEMEQDQGESVGRVDEEQAIVLDTICRDLRIRYPDADSVRVSAAVRDLPAADEVEETAFMQPDCPAGCGSVAMGLAATLSRSRP
ncbi:MAG: hypothetical protein WCA04_11490 [Geobacteraceae bacterium]